MVSNDSNVTNIFDNLFVKNSDITGDIRCKTEALYKYPVFVSIDEYNIHSCY